MSTKTKEPEFVIVDSLEMTTGEREFVGEFGRQIVGQPEIVSVAQMIYTAYKNPLRDKKRPLGIYYLVGKSRTGKSKTARALAQIFHGDEEALTRISAGGYDDAHEMSDIKGAPPSYVGYRDPADPKHKLEPHDVDSYSLISPHNLRRVRLGSGEVIDIIVIEEFEKACPDFFKFWMDAFDRGKITLRNGEVVDLSNAVFILTSNLATDEIDRYEQGGMGLVNKGRKATHAVIKEEVEKAMRATYRKEFRNRLDAVIVFRDLTAEDIAAIVNLEIDGVQDRIIDQMPRGEEFVLDVQPAARKFLLAAADGEVAELKRSIERHLMQRLGRLLSGGKIKGGDLVRVDHVEGSSELTFAVAKGAAKQALADKMEINPNDDTPETRKGLAFQRRVSRAKQKAKSEKDEVKTFKVGVFRPSQDDFVDQLRNLMRDIKLVVEARIVAVTTPMERPWRGEVVIKATAEQVALLRDICPELEIVPVADEGRAPKPKSGRKPTCDCQ